MKLRAVATSHPLVLLLCAAVGALLGQVSSIWQIPAQWVLGVGIALLELVCLPLLMVATVSGLRHMLVLPNPFKRSGMVLFVGLTLLWTCAQLGALLAQFVGLGDQLSPDQLLEMGTLAMGSVHDIVQLHGAQVLPSHDPVWTVPDNAFKALAGGNLVSVMFCTLFFGLAYVLNRHTDTDMLDDVLEAVYRALEKIIVWVNMALPLLWLALAAQWSAAWDWDLLQAMASFLLGFGGLVAVLSVGLVFVVFKWGTSSAATVAVALKLPMLLSLVAPSPVSAVPATVEALSGKLGFSRGVVEFLVPISAVFLRAGHALQYAMMAVFIAHIYKHPLSPFQFLGLAPVAVWAAFASAGSSGLAGIGFSSVVVLYLDLPPEAMLPIFLAIGLFTEGPARLLSLLCACALTAIVCAGLPVERSEQAAKAAPLQPIHFILDRQTLSFLAGGFVLLSGLCVAAGVAWGMRSPPQPLSHRTMPIETVANPR